MKRDNFNYFILARLPFQLLKAIFLFLAKSTIPKMFSFRLVTVLVILLVPFSAKGQLPDDLLDYIPSVCRASLDTDLLPCAIENLCFSLLPSEEEIDAIPTASEVQGCVDIETALCPVTTRCPLCKGKADDLFKCVIANSGDIPPNVTELINSCTLECDASMSISVSSVPTSSPGDDTTTTDNPTIDDPAPTDVQTGPTNETPADDSETSIPVDSGTGPIMASTVVEITTGLLYGAALLLFLWE